MANRITIIMKFMVYFRRYIAAIQACALKSDRKSEQDTLIKDEI